MRDWLTKGAEVAMLFCALLFTLPYIPSHQIEQLPLLPGAAFALICFAGSRALRWHRNYLLIGLETLGFLAFVVIANEVANIIYIS